MNKQSVDEAILKARYYAERGDFAEAMNAVEYAMMVFPNFQKSPNHKNGKTQDKNSQPILKNYSVVIERLVKIYARGQYEAVIQEASQLTKELSTEPLVWNLLGSAAAELGRLKQAITAFRNVITINPNDPKAYNNLGSIFYKIGRI
jgi:tetratricopeptide (TPR) repeat protein